MDGPWHPLPIPSDWTGPQGRVFVDFARQLQVASMERLAVESAGVNGARSDAGLRAALHVIADLAHQGWAVRVEESQTVLIRPPQAALDPGDEKSRVRRQELLKREEQLSSTSVRRFVSNMERPREFGGQFVSVFSLMRDGRELADELRKASASTDDPGSFDGVIEPYVQVVGNRDRCPHTGLRLMDIWRYFRHTWANQYSSTPGRSMLILVRDRAAPFHPVIGIAALGSAIVQIRERDQWIGWDSTTFLEALAESPTLRMARWIVSRLDDGLRELYLDDLIEDGLYWPSLWAAPDEESIARLVKEAEVRRRDHHRFVRRADFKAAHAADDSEFWQRRARSDLFRSKRCLALADLLQARAALLPFLYPKPSRAGLRRALDDRHARDAISRVLRRSRAESVGTEIADLTVCGAVAPYNAVLGGKLVSMLAVSPSVVRAYHERYAGSTSEIASSLAGRPIHRRSHLVFVGTTSLYGSGSSQYNRVKIPKAILGGTGVVAFLRLGKSRSFGTSHLSRGAAASLLTLSEQTRNGVRVNSIFGEGVNPKLRKLRDGLNLLGWPSNDLLQHHRPRLIYGVPLVSNLLPYLLGADEEPRYIFRRALKDDAKKITSWWIERWLRERAKSPKVLADLEQNTLTRPIRHGARVSLPPLPDDHPLRPAATSEG